MVSGKPVQGGDMSEGDAEPTPEYGDMSTPAGMGTALPLLIVLLISAVFGGLVGWWVGG